MKHILFILKTYLKHVAPQKTNLFRISVLLTSLSACSPFGAESSISKSFTDFIPDFILKTEVSQVSSGGVSKYSTDPGMPSQNFEVYVTVGAVVKESTEATVDGYTVTINRHNGFK